LHDQYGSAPGPVGRHFAGDPDDQVVSAITAEVARGQGTPESGSEDADYRSIREACKTTRAATRAPGQRRQVGTRGFFGSPARAYGADDATSRYPIGHFNHLDQRTPSTLSTTATRLTRGALLSSGVAALKVPPLRERPDDIGASTARHPRPGNVRELLKRCALRPLAVWSDEPIIRTEDAREALLPAASPQSRVLDRPLGNDFSLSDALADVACHYPARAMQEANGNRTWAAQLVGPPSCRTLTSWLARYGGTYRLPQVAKRPLSLEPPGGLRRGGFRLGTLAAADPRQVAAALQRANDRARPSFCEPTHPVRWTSCASRIAPPRSSANCLRSWPSPR
jgi:hypothetical protein